MKEEDIKAKYRITDKQYNFAKYIVQGDSPTEAYRKAYDTQADARSVSSQAGKTLRNPKVAALISDMQREAIEKDRNSNELIMSAEEIMVWWSGVITSTSRSVKMSDKIKCSELLAKAHGMFTERISAEINSTNDIVINISNDNDGDE